MDFRKELAKFGYNKGNSIDVETLVSEILPEIFEKEILEHLNLLYSMKNSTVDTFTDEEDMITMKWFEQFKCE